MSIRREIRTAFVLAFVTCWPAVAPAQAPPRKPSSPATSRGSASEVRRASGERPLDSLKQKATLSSRRQPAELPPDESAPLETVPRGLPATPPIEALTLEDIEAIALENNPSLGEAQGFVVAARGNMLQVGLYPNFETGYSGQQVGSHGLAEQDGVYVAQRFVTGGKLRLNRAVAAQEVARAEQIYSAQRLRVLTDVHVSYYDVLTSQRQLELTQELVGIGDKAVGVAEALLKAKEGSRVDLLQAKIELDTAKILLERSRNQRTAAWRGLTAVMGTPGMMPQTLRGELESGVPDITWEEAFERLMAQSPEVLAALADVDRARFMVQRSRREIVPDVTVQGIYQHDNGIKGRDGAIQASIPVPLWNRNQGNKLRAEGELIAAERAVERVELGLQRRLAPVYQRYANARQQVDKYSKDILPNAKSSLELVREGYRAGEFGFLNLLVAQRTYSQTTLAYVESLRELWSAAVEIRGLLLSDSLQGPRQ